MLTYPKEASKMKFNWPSQKSDRTERPWETRAAALPEAAAAGRLHLPPSLWTAFISMACK